MSPPTPVMQVFLSSENENYPHLLLPILKWLYYCLHQHEFTVPLAQKDKSCKIILLLIPEPPERPINSSTESYQMTA